MLSTKTIVIAGAGLAAAAGLALAGASLAGAEGVSTAATSGYGYGHTGGAPGSGAKGQEGGGAATGNTDPSKPMRSDEQLLTGDTAAKVTAAAQAKEPGATIERVETDSEGFYEAHMVRADGTHIIVQVGSDFTVTGVQEHGAGGGPGGGNGGGKGRSGGGTPSGNPEAPAPSAS